MKDLIDQTLNQIGNAEEVKQAAPIINKVITGLKRGKPAWRHTIRSQEEEDGIKKEWAAALKQHGITTQEQLANGFKYARLDNSPFFPSVGQFIEWCNKKEPEKDPSHMAFLPEPEFTDEDQKRGQNWLEKIKEKL